VSETSLDQDRLGQLLLAEFSGLRSSTIAGDKRFGVILLGCFFLLASTGILFKQRYIDRNLTGGLGRRLDASFLLREKLKKKKVIDLTKKTQLKAKEEKPEPVLKKTVVVKRRVYGLRRVFARGLGSGAGGRDAVVSKLGNTLEKAPDTIRATREELKGTLISVTKITAMPKILHTVKPKYTDEMKENGITGKVKAKVLVDTDGIAKKIIIIKHLGYGTREAAIQAIKKMKFRPALQGKIPVAVWIPITFRFELQQ